MNSTVLSPLRYPGGKSLFFEFFSNFIAENGLESSVYAEPYCGGAGAGIKLLLEKKVNKLLLNDADKSIYSFWYSLKHYGSDFIHLFDSTKVDLENWKRLRSIKKEGLLQHTKNQIIELGFSTFFLNRCNRSGILNAGPIGGQSNESQHEAQYKIDARYNRSALRKRLLKVIEMADRIEITNLDALNFLENVVGSQPQKEQKNTLVYLDPPYYTQGSNLYLNYYKSDDHEELANFLTHVKTDYKWILSYDNCSFIRKLYSSFDQYKFYLNYSAQNSKLGSELVVFSNNSMLPESKLIRKLKGNKRIELELMSI